jgi:hypothetical protein
MNEPSVFDAHKTIPDSVLHRVDEAGFHAYTVTHRQIHNFTEWKTRALHSMAIAAQT